MRNSPSTLDALRHHSLPAIGQPNYPLPPSNLQLPSMNNPQLPSMNALPPNPQLPSMNALPPPPPPHGYIDHSSNGNGQLGMGAEHLQPPKSPVNGSQPTAEQLAKTAAALKPYSATSGGWRFELDVVQQPRRARMCGFGDKDRRPITPPPCVRLVVIDDSTGKEVDCNEIEHCLYVLNVDLWSDDALKEVNLVRHTTSTPSISSTTPASFGSVESASAAFTILPSSRPEGPFAGGPPGQPPYGHPSAPPYGGQPPFGQVSSYMQQNGYGQAPYFTTPDYRPDMPGGVPSLPSQAPGMSPYGQGRMYGGPPEMNIAARMSIQGSPPQGMFTRNLIGSLAASAFRLTDPTDKIGIWFVLQDLSVRTEGNFRLRFSFVNVGSPASDRNGGSSPPTQSSIVNTGKAPVLASCFSDTFTVYSAKKFPGVCESTALSKCFASQGIKIPIRKEGAGGKGANNDDDYDD